VRAADDATRDAAVADIDAELARIAARRGVELSVSQSMRVTCGACSPRLMERLAECVESAGAPVLRLASGAGHDAMVMARVTDVCMLFVRCGNGGISHNPLETMTAEDADLAARVLLDFFRRTGGQRGA
jgi:acetylornithine deacetylase/succinyl-diaminopimelate desuccinylase-like protein